jgi:hypothetical protein
VPHAVNQNETAVRHRHLRDALPGVETAQTARHLVSLIEGLFGISTEQQAMGILDAQLDSIFGPARSVVLSRLVLLEVPSQ